MSRSINELTSRFTKQYASADEGQYYTATNPTPGTGLTTIAAQATFVSTAPFFILQNPSTSVKRAYLDFLRLQCTAPGTAGTNIRSAIKIDTGSGARYSSGGSQLTPKQSGAADGVIAASCATYAGALVATAETSANLIDSQLIRNVIPVIGDTYLFTFGANERSVGSLIPSGTGITQQVVDYPPIVIGPGQSFLFYIWLASQSAASSYEITCGFSER